MNNFTVADQAFCRKVVSFFASLFTVGLLIGQPVTNQQTAVLDYNVQLPSVCGSEDGAFIFESNGNLPASLQFTALMRGEVPISKTVSAVANESQLTVSGLLSGQYNAVKLIDPATNTVLFYQPGALFIPENCPTIDLEQIPGRSFTGSAQEVHGGAELSDNGDNPESVSCPGNYITNPGCEAGQGGNWDYPSGGAVFFSAQVYSGAKQHN